MSCFTRWCNILLLMAAGFLSLEATATPIDLNDFIGDPEVTISSDGVSAEFTESESSTVVLLTNDPFLSDPFVIVPGPSTILTFNFVFNEAPGDDGTFSAYLFLAEDGPLNGVLDVFSVDNTQAGMFSFDLSDYVSGSEVLVLGLQFELFDRSFYSADTTASVSNLALTQVVPVPAAVWLFGSGLIGLVGIARRKVRT